MQAASADKTTFGQLLVQMQSRDTKNPDTRGLGISLAEILHVLLSYVNNKILRLLMGVSPDVLKQVVQSNIPIPLSLCVNSDFGDRLQLAKSKLEALKGETKLLFSLELLIRSNRVGWADDLDVLIGLDSYIKPKDDAEDNAEVVHSIAIGNLHVDLKEINKSMAECIASMEHLRNLDLSRYYCNDVKIFKYAFVSMLFPLRTLREVKVNLCSVPALPTLFMRNNDLDTLKVYANAGDGDRSCIFSTLSDLSVGKLTKISLHFLRVVTRGESEVLREFVQGQRQLSKLSLKSCEVSNPACDNVVGLLKQTRLETLKLHGLHMPQPALCRVLEQIGKMTQLKSLTITHNHCNETNTESLCSGLRNMTNLRRLNLSYLSLSAHGVSELAGALTNLQRLQQLDLSNNRFHDIGVSSLVAALIAFSKLTRLRLDNCGMTENVRRQMQTVLRKQM